TRPCGDGHTKTKALGCPWPRFRGVVLVFAWGIFGDRSLFCGLAKRRRCMWLPLSGDSQLRQDVGAVVLLPDCIGDSATTTIHSTIDRGEHVGVGPLHFHT